MWGRGRFNQRRGGGGNRSRRMYGFFRCGDCGKLWESSNTYTKPGSVGYYKQDCKDCKSSWEPERVEPIRCSMCGQEDCVCTDEDLEERRHIDPSKPHRSDLCEKCKRGHPCHRS